MAIYKNQHLVPACYLKNFIDENPLEIKSNPSFEKGLYVNDKILSSKWVLKSIRNKIFTKAYFYTLKNEDTKNPIIEKFLSSIESDYGKHLNKILVGNIDKEVLSFISYFASIQLIRSQRFIEMFQETFDKVAINLDNYVGGNGYKNEFVDIAKKLILSTDIGEIFYEHAHVFYNQTNFKFITSDTPVLRRNVNITDMRILFPKNTLNENVSESLEFPLFFFPLNPHIAFASCKLFKNEIDIKLFLNNQDHDLLNLFYLNLEMIKNAQQYVYSSIKEPLQGQESLSKILSSKEDALYVKIYTSKKRIISNVIIESDESNSISLILKEPNKLEGLNIGDSVNLIEVIENGFNARGMRECLISEINMNTGYIQIESRIKLSS